MNAVVHLSSESTDYARGMRLVAQFGRQHNCHMEHEYSLRHRQAVYMNVCL